MNELESLLDLADVRLGGAALWATDDFFAEKENLLKATKPVFLEHEYTDRGKWMDGWESRRKRTPGHDACIVRLGLPGIVRGIVVDTSFFRGNYPARAALFGCAARSDARVDELLSDRTRWFPLLGEVPLKGDHANTFAVDALHAVSHVRLDIFPDGGVARLRVHGDVVPDWRSLGGSAREQDLASVETGARVLTCSDMFFGPKNNLVMPGRAANMGEGWETKRRRGPGHDWVIVELAGPGTIARIEVDTNHFKGNFPDTCSIEACDGRGHADVTSLPWKELLPRTALSAHTRHFFVEELQAVGVVTHVRLNVFPDGGVSRLRVHGTLTHEGRLAAGLRGLHGATKESAQEKLLACCGSSAWARAMADALPLADGSAVFRAAEACFDGLGEVDWLEAFRSHPRIGESKAQKGTGAQAATWSAGEQKGVTSADDATRAALAEGQRRYEDKFGFLFIVCASGRSPAEILAVLQERLAGTAEAEKQNARIEQRKITRLRLERLLLP